MQEIEAIKARVKEMEEEAEKLKEMQGEVEKQMMSSKASECMHAHIQGVGGVRCAIHIQFNDVI